MALRRIEIVVDVDNHRSQRVAEKVGATREGIARQRCKYGHTWHDAFVFSLLRFDLGDSATPV